MDCFDQDSDGTGVADCSPRGRDVSRGQIELEAGGDGNTLQPGPEAGVMYTILCVCVFMWVHMYAHAYGGQRLTS